MKKNDTLLERVVSDGIPNQGVGMTSRSPQDPKRKNANTPSLDSTSESFTDPSLFSLLTLSLGNAALVELGIVDDPSSGQGVRRMPNLNAARQNIDLLEMLETKTKGNLTPDEVQVLQGLLFDLRMKVIEAEKRP